MKTHGILCVLFPLLFGFCDMARIKKPPEAERGMLDLSAWDFRQDGPVKLTGQWEFHWNRLLAPADFPPAEQSAAKTRWIRVPSAWNGTRWNGEELSGHGFATMRLRVRLPPNDRHAIRFEGAATSHRVYVNGRPVAANGIVARTADAARPQFLPLVVELPANNAAGEAEFVVQIANFSHRRGGMWSPIQIGRSAQIRTVRERSLVIDILLAGSMFIIGLYHLAFYSMRRRSRDALYFGIFCLLLALRAIFYGERFMLQTFPDFPFELLLKIEYLTFYLAAAFFVMYFRSIFPDELSTLAVRIMQGLAAIFCAFVLVTPLALYSFSAPVYQFITLAFGLHIFISAVLALRRGRRDAGLYLGGMAVFLVTFTNDILYFNFLSPFNTLTPLGMFTFIFVQAVLLARRYSGAFQQVEELSGALEKRNEELERLDKLKDEFLSNTSHELRTPLNGIIGLTEGLIAGDADDPDRTRQNLKLIARSGRRLSHLVNDILDFEKLRHHDLILNRVAVDLRTTVEVVLALVRTMANDKRIELRNEVGAECPPVRADEGRLEQVLHNLVGNAIKYTEAGTVRVFAREIGGGRVEVSVADTGIGVPGEEHRRIFESFVQVHPATGGKSSGTGLGLPITRELIELHGGTIDLESSPGHGSRFYFTLPMAGPGVRSASRATGESDAPGLPAIEPISFESRDAFGPAEGEAAARPGSRPLVLLVDDEPVNLEVMRSHLEPDGIRTRLAPDGRQAREILRRGLRPDLVILDIMMPYISGLDLARELRRSYTLTELPILMVTARTRTEDLIAAVDAGANDYLTKPFEREEFLIRGRNLIALKRSEERNREAGREAARRERARINADLHDHIGASLTDIKLLSEAAMEDPSVNPAFAEKLRSMITGAVSMLRSDLLNLEDMEQLAEHFFDGMHTILLRRYVEAGRELNFLVPDDVASAAFQSSLDEDLRTVLYSVLKEIATNDLKYGTGPGRYEFDLARGEFRLIFQGRSFYRLERHGTGRGTAGMIQRLSEIGGTVQMRMGAPDGNGGGNSDHARPIRIEIQVPGPTKTV